MESPDSNLLIKLLDLSAIGHEAADYEVVCELVHNDQICFQLFKDWTKPDWFGCAAPIESLPPQTVCRVRFLGRSAIPEGSRGDTLGFVDVPISNLLSKKQQPASSVSSSENAIGKFCAIATRAYGETKHGGWLNLHPRPLENTRRRQKPYRVYVTLSERKLRWFGKEPNPDKDQKAHLASWHIVGLDKTIKIAVPSKIHKNVPGAFDLHSSRIAEQLNPLTFSAVDGDHNSSVLLKEILELVHRSVQQQVKEMHPEFGESADMFFFGTAIDGRLRTSIFAFKLGRFTPTPNPLTKSKMIILKEGPLVISAFKATNKSTLVHAVLVSTGLKWYSDASKRRLIGEVNANSCTVRRATAEEECAETVELLGAHGVRRERYERRCFTVLSRRVCVIKSKSKIVTTVWVFDVLPSVRTCTNLKEGEVADTKKGASPGMLACHFPAAIDHDSERVNWINCIRSVLGRCSKMTPSYKLESAIEAENSGDKPADTPESNEEIAHQMLDLAKECKWGALKAKLKQYPHLVNHRPAVRKFAVLHQVVFATHPNSLKFLKWMSTYFGSRLNWNQLSQNGKTALKIVMERNRTEATNVVRKLMDQWISTQDVMDDAVLANQMIDLAKFGNWNELKAELKMHPNIVNFRPPERKYAILHQAIYAGCMWFVKWLTSFFGGKLNWNILTGDGQTVLEVAEARKKGDMVTLVLELMTRWETGNWHKITGTGADWEQMLAILSLDSLVLLTAAEKQRLWKSRESVMDMSLLQKFIQVVNWGSKSQVEAALAQIKKCTADKTSTLFNTVLECVNLLSSRNTDSRVRACTVEFLDRLKAEPFELQQYLNQLVQALKFESTLPPSASPLAQYLFKRAQESPIVIAIKLFWLLEVEVQGCPHPCKYILWLHGALRQCQTKVTRPKKRAPPPVPPLPTPLGPAAAAPTASAAAGAATKTSTPPLSAAPDASASSSAAETNPIPKTQEELVAAKNKTDATSSARKAPPPPLPPFHHLTVATSSSTKVSANESAKDSSQVSAKKGSPPPLPPPIAATTSTKVSAAKKPPPPPLPPPIAATSTSSANVSANESAKDPTDSLYHLLKPVVDGSAKDSSQVSAKKTPGPPRPPRISRPPASSSVRSLSKAAAAASADASGVYDSEDTDSDDDDRVDMTVADIIAEQEQSWGAHGFIAKITRAVRRANKLKCDPLQLTVDSRNLRLAGYVTKRAFRRTSKVGSFRDNWQKRWLVLYKRGLQYYKSETATDPKGFIPLTADSTICECEEGKFGSRHPYCFEITINSHMSMSSPKNEDEPTDPDDPNALPELPPPKYNMFYASCSSQRDRFMWISHISHAIVDLVTEESEFKQTQAEREKGVSKFEKRHNKKVGDKTIALIFKVGDDLRQDMLVLQMFLLFERFWKQNELDLPLTTYAVVSTWRDGGAIELIDNAMTVADVQTKYGGVFGTFRQNPITKYLQEHNPEPADFEAALDTFMRSAAASCVATCVLGIGDRHNDNIMITSDGRLFHIDFGHFMGHTLTFQGMSREQTRFVFTKSMASTIVQLGDDAFQTFTTLCVDAYLTLRDHPREILGLLNMMVSADLPELENGAAVEFTRQMLNLHMNDNEASAWFIAQIRDCLSQGKGFLKSFDDTMHILVQENGKSLTGQLTTLLRTELNRLCSRSSFLTPYSVKLGPILIDRCRVSGSNARPVFLVFRATSDSNLRSNLQSRFRQLPGAKSLRRATKSSMSSRSSDVGDMGTANDDGAMEAFPNPVPGPMGSTRVKDIRGLRDFDIVLRPRLSSVVRQNMRLSIARIGTGSMDAAAGDADAANDSPAVLYSPPAPLE